MKDNTKPNSYHVPCNYKNENILFNIPFLKKQNLLEALIVGIIIYAIIDAIPFTKLFHIIFLVITEIPTLLFFTIGFNNFSVFQKLIIYIKFMTQKCEMNISMPLNENSINENMTEDGMLHMSKAEQILAKLKK